MHEKAISEPGGRLPLRRPGCGVAPGMRAPSTGIETVASRAPVTTGTLALRAAEVGERSFAVGVALCTAAFAAFVFVHLTYWPPHEDETLALFVGRGSLGHV